MPEGPSILLTGHLGNWEVLGCALALKGFPPVSVATPIKNPVVDGIVQGLRTVTGQRIIARQGAVRGMLKTLRDGGRVALLQDQNVRIHEGGVHLEFFGVPAATSPAAGMLAARLGVPVVMGFCLPEADGRYRIYAPSPPLRADPSAAVEAEAIRMTERILREYEKAIGAHPDCWLWMYKRWKNRRPGDDPARYPFYTRE
jgi:KDO2-lipid IV(A) lauroyltransferase